MNTKRLFVFLLTTVLMLAVGCSDKVENTASESVIETQPETEAATELDTYEPLATVRERNIEENGDFDYEIYEGRTIITKYNGNAANVELPAEMEGVPVCEVDSPVQSAYPLSEQSGLCQNTLPVQSAECHSRFQCIPKWCRPGAKPEKRRYLLHTPYGSLSYQRC